MARWQSPAYCNGLENRRRLIAVQGFESLPRRQTYNKKGAIVLDFVYKEHFSYLTNICLNLTDACNFACKYCFVEQNPHYMTYETAKAAVNFLLENLEKKRKYLNDPNIKASLTYFGGEPTIMWDSIIVPLTTYIKTNNLPIYLNMTTNASLLNEERNQWLKDNKIPIL